MKQKVIVVGAGAAGLLAAAEGARLGAKVTLLEKTPRPANKLRICGKGRGNLTNAGPELNSDLQSVYPGGGKFLFGSLARFDSLAVQELFRSLGVELKVERGGRVFPVSDNAHQAADALVAHAKSQGVGLKTKTAVKKLLVTNGCIAGVETVDERKFYADSVIVAVGGASYPATGSTGDGYVLGREAGHTVVQPLPALVPLVTKQDWVGQLDGLTLRNVAVRLFLGNSTSELFGEMQFTHYGVGGPVILSLSRQASIALYHGLKPRLAIDLKPALDFSQLESRLLKDFRRYVRKNIKNGLVDLLPKALIPVIIRLSGLSEHQSVHQVTKQQRLRILHQLKGMRLDIEKTLPITAAIVTTGGIKLDQINPRTMESRLVKGLYFAGEVLDVDGLTGGYNLQAAFSTGYVAGTCAAGAGR